jgi:CRISPR-associated DxTHG motif protein
MRKVYLSFLGLGQYIAEHKKYSYRKTVYVLNERLSSPTRFVQAAEQELLGRDRFDVLYIAATQASAETHFEALNKKLSSCRGTVELLLLEEDMSQSGQWASFEKIFAVIQNGDELCVDLTHGYRSIPVIFSAAINFLQKTKRIQLSHVFYGAYEKDKEQAPLVDMKSFFDINIWADAVTRLTDDADAGGIAEASASTNRHQFAELTNAEFAANCSNTTKRIKNVDVNNVAGSAHNLLQQIDNMKKDSSPGAVFLLDLIKEKFAPLTNPYTGNPDKTGYTLEYFEIQLNLAHLLIEHGLFMQAFTVMREWLSSLVMLYFEFQGKMNAGKRRKRCERYGGVFFNMLQFKEKKWRFQGKEDQRDRILPFYNALKKNGVLDLLIKQKTTVAKNLSDYRNGFDHAWLGKAGMKEDIEQQAVELLKILEDSLQRLQRYLSPDD